jgi:uncharacterized membrane protein YdjX (TVP38/TMEM64 family)
MSAYPPTLAATIELIGALNVLVQDAGNWIQGLGEWAFVVAPLAMIVVAIIPFPAEIPAAANGMVFGPMVGGFITWSGALVGAQISFEVSRRFGRPLGERYLGVARLEQADKLVAAAGWPALLTLRLIPAVAFTAVNWAAGLTDISRRRFFWTTAVGILPGAILFTLSGTGLASLYRMNPAAAWVLGFAVVAVSWWAWLRYRKKFGAHPS